MHSTSVWRLGPRRERSGRDDASGRCLRRRPFRRVRDSHEHFRAQPGRGLRQRGAEAADFAANRHRQGKGVLRRDRARCGFGDRQDQNARGTAWRRLHDHRRQDLDFDGAGRRQNAAARTHRAVRCRPQADRRPQFILHHARSPPRRGARDRKNGPQGGRLKSTLHRRRPRTGLAKKAAASNICSMDSMRNASWSPPKRSGWAAPRWRGRAPTPRAASCSAGRSDRTNPFSIR